MKIHELTDVRSTDIGKNTTIWQFCVVMPGAKIGSDCNICAGSFIEDDVVIASRAIVPKYTTVPAGETWAGIPAKSIKKKKVSLI